MVWCKINECWDDLFNIPCHMGADAEFDSSLESGDTLYGRRVDSALSMAVAFSKDHFCEYDSYRFC